MAYVKAPKPTPKPLLFDVDYASLLAAEEKDIPKNCLECFELAFTYAYVFDEFDFYTASKMQYSFVDNKYRQFTSSQGKVKATIRVSYTTGRDIGKWYYMAELLVKKKKKPQKTLAVVHLTDERSGDFEVVIGSRIETLVRYVVVERSPHFKYQIYDWSWGRDISW